MKWQPTYAIIHIKYNVFGGHKIGKNLLDAINFLKILETFGEEAAKQTLDDVNKGVIRESTIEKYLYTDETKEEFSERIKNE